MKVMGHSTIGTVDVRADGIGLSSRAGTALLALTAQRLGLTDGLSGAPAGTRERRSGHDPGRVLCDLAVMAADGGRCVSDLQALAGQPALFGDLASVSTARRVLLSLGDARSREQLGPIFGEDLTGVEVRHLMTREWARFPDDVLWRRSKLGLTMPEQDRQALAEFMANPAAT